MSQQKSEDQALVSFDQKFKSDPSIIRILERSDDYVAVGDDAAKAAQIVFKTTSALKRLPGGTPLVTLKPQLLSALLKDALQQLAMRVEIYETAPGSRTTWKLKKQASPGNLEEVEDLFSSGYDQNPVLLAVKITGGSSSSRHVGVSFLDRSSRHLGLCEFEDNDLFSNFESLVIQIGAKEAIIPSDAGHDTTKIKALMDRLSVAITTVKPSHFQSKDVDQDIVRLIGKSSLDLSRELSLDTAIGAAGAIIKHLQMMAHSKDYGHYTIGIHNLSDFLKLDASAISALNVMPSPRDSSKTMSLFGLLNHCKTVAGTRLLGQWLKQPLMDHDAIVKRHELVGAFMDSSITRQMLRENFHVVPDLANISRNFHRGKAKLEHVVRIYDLVNGLGKFVEVLSDLTGVEDIVKETYIGPLQSSFGALAKLVELVETTIDVEAAKRNEYIVRGDFDETLRSLQVQKDSIVQEIKEAHHAAAETLGQEVDKKLKLERHHIYGWVFRLTRTDAGCLRNREGFTEWSTQKAGVYFVSRELRKLASDFDKAQTDYNSAQSAISREVVNTASTYEPLLAPLAGVLAHLDVLVSFAEASAFAKIPYVRPTMRPRGTGNIVLKQARHPCMEAQDDVVFIPNDVSLLRDSSEFLIITGPNMGGKSTYIRQVGVISLMAQIGCFVPCDEAELSIVDCVLARVGAGDSQLKGISTFMAEMLETASILKTATKESLIVIDELGRGTSTYDGFGLAWAISQHIIQAIGCFTLFATHFHELTELGSIYSTAQNLHVLANSENTDDITLLYQVAPGVSDKSFGIHVAEVVNFPDKVVRMAKRKAQELEELDGDQSLTPEQVQEGNEMLLKVLKQWAEEIQGNTDSSAVLKLRDAINADREELEKQPFLRQVLASL